MDPSFLAIIAYQNHQYSNILMSARLQAEEKRKLAERQKVLDAADRMWADLLHDSTKFPERVWSSAKIILEDMNRLGAVPESFEKKADREKTTFLWHTFLNILENCTRQLSPEQVVKCQNGIQAIWMKRYIDTILPRLYLYQQFQDVIVELEYDKKILRRNEKILYSVLTLIMLSWLAWLRINNSVVSSDSILGVIFAVTFPGSIIRSQLRSKYTKKSREARLPYQQVERDESFWLGVKQKFNGIPSREVLEQKRREQEEIIKSSFSDSEQTRNRPFDLYELPGSWETF